MRKRYIKKTFTNNYSISGDDYIINFIQTDGHTKGSSYGWVADKKLLIAGDTYFNKMFPFGTDPSVDPISWHKALKEMITLKPELIIPGHGPIATFKDLQEISEFFNRAIYFIQTRLDEGLTPQQIAKDPDCPEYYSEGEKRREWIKIQSFKRWAEIMKE